MPEKQKEINLTKAVIDVDNHTHDGKKLKKGDEIHVTQEQREWLLKHEVIKA